MKNISVTMILRFFCIITKYHNISGTKTLFLFLFFLPQENQINVEDKKIVEEQNPIIPLDAPILKKENGKKKIFFIVSFFIVLILLFFLTKFITKQKIEIPGIYAEFVWGEIKLNLFLGNIPEEEKKFYTNFFYFFEQVFVFLNLKTKIKGKGTVLLLKFCSKELLESYYQNSCFFDYNMIFSHIVRMVITTDKNHLENLKKIQNSKIKEWKKLEKEVEILGLKEKVITISTENIHESFFSLQSFFNLTLSKSEVDFCKNFDFFRLSEGDYFISNLYCNDETDNFSINNNQSKYKTYKPPVLFQKTKYTTIFESNSFLLFLFIIFKDKKYVEPVKEQKEIFKVTKSYLMKIGYRISKKYYYFGKDFFVIFDGINNNIEIFETCYKNIIERWHVFSEHLQSDRVIKSFSQISAPGSLFSLMFYLCQKKNENSFYEIFDLDETCFSEYEILQKIQFDNCIKSYINDKSPKSEKLNDLDLGLL